MTTRISETAAYRAYYRCQFFLDFLHDQGNFYGVGNSSVVLDHVSLREGSIGEHRHNYCIRIFTLRELADFTRLLRSHGTCAGHHWNSFTDLLNRCLDRCLTFVLEDVPLVAEQPRTVNPCSPLLTRQSIWHRILFKLTRLPFVAGSE